MKDIKGYEGLYAITSCGKVWSYKSQKFLKLTDDGRGYLIVSLCKGGKGKAFRVHRLVAETYIPNPNNLPEVNHKDEVKINNCINNLEWCDSKYNNNYGTRTTRSAEKRRKPVYCVELDKVFDSMSAAAAELGLKVSAISLCCKGERLKTTGGYHFRYAE